MDFNPSSGGSMLSRVMACLLQDNKDVEAMFRTLPFSSRSASGRKVQALRISFYLYLPTGVGSLLRAWVRGERMQWWTRRFVGWHMPLLTRRMVESSLSSTRQTGFSRDSHGVPRVREPELAHPDLYLAVRDAPALTSMHSKLERALQQARQSGEKESKLDLGAILATAPRSGVSPRLVLPLSPSDASSLWRFVSHIQPLVSQLRFTPPSSWPEGVAQQDYEAHLAPGVWSGSIRRFTRESDPFAGMDARAVAKVEKTLARATHLLLHALMPHWHGPGADEMCTNAQIAEATRRRGEGKQGKHCLRPCIRDQCTDASHLHLPSFFHFYLFAQHLVLQGEETVQRVLLRPESGSSFVRGFSLATGLLPQAMFHPTMLAFHAAKVRMIARISFPYQLEQGGILPGFLSVYNQFLSREFRSAEEGAISQYAFLPEVSAPVRYDQYWRVDISGMKRVHAPGLQMDGEAVAVPAKAASKRQ